MYQFSQALSSTGVVKPSRSEQYRERRMGGEQFQEA